MTSTAVVKTTSIDRGTTAQVNGRHKWATVGQDGTQEVKVLCPIVLRVQSSKLPNKLGQEPLL